MTKVALRGLAGRKLRAALTAIAIVLGVAMISGTYVLTDTVDRAFSQIFAESYAGTDAVVTGKGVDISIDGETVAAPPVDEAILETVRAVPEVALATGSIVDDYGAKILTPEGEAVSTGGAPSFGFGIDPDPALSRFNPLELSDGRWPAAEDEVVIDVGTADEQEYAVGDRVQVSTLEPTRSFELVGVARYGDVDSLGTATFAVFTIPAAQELFDRQGQFDAVSAAAVEGVSEDELVEAIAAAIPDDAKVVSATQEAADESDEISQFTSIIRYFLLAFAGIALFVGAFVIFNTFSITVAQRTREFATLRTIGASRRQVLGSVILESLVIGLVASLIGLALGVLLAEAIQALFRSLGFELPTSERVFALRTVVVALAVGVGITLAAGLFPAIRATRVPPIAAVREGAELPRSRIAPFVPWIAGIVVALALAVLGRAMFVDDLGTADRLLSIAAGVLLLFVGVAMLSSQLVRPIAVVTNPVGRWVLFAFTVLAWPFWLAPYWLLRLGVFGPGSMGRRVLALVGGLAASLAGAMIIFGLTDAFPLTLSILVVPVIVLVMWLRTLVTNWRPEWPVEFPNVIPDRVATDTGGRNARRNPQRTAATAAALMIGVALVSFVATLTDGMKASNREAIEEQVVADYVLTASDGYTPFPAAIGDAFSQSSSLELVTHVRSGVAEVNGDDSEVSGIEPDKILDAYVFKWTDGGNEALAGLGTTGAIVTSNYAEDHDLALGDTIRMLSESNRTAEVEVIGTYEPPPFYPLLDSVTVSKDLFDSLFDRPQNRWTWANVPGEPTAETTTALASAISGFPDSQVETREEWIEREDEDFNEFLTFLYVLLTFSVFISIFGMINTLVLSVYERTREIGMLRAIGMTRRQIRRMIRQESVITALIGAALGLPLGIFLAALVNRALSEFDLRFSIPVVQLAILTIVAIVIGILAAIAPARRAAKLNPLEAIAYE